MSRTKQVTKTLKKRYKDCAVFSATPAIYYGLYDITHGIDLGVNVHNKEDIEVNKSAQQRSRWWKDEHYEPMFGDVNGWFFLPLGIALSGATSAIGVALAAGATTIALVQLPIAKLEDTLRPIKQKPAQDLDKPSAQQEDKEINIISKPDLKELNSDVPKHSKPDLRAKGKEEKIEQNQTYSLWSKPIVQSIEDSNKASSFSL